jgi:tetratricopeptide (TPR) repeat protein
MSSLANGLDAAKAGFIPRVLFRSAVSTALVTPWAGLAMSLAAPVGCPTRWQIVAALVFAVVPPGAYADRLVETRSAKLATFASTGRFVLARDVLVGLTDVAGDPAAADRRERIEKDIAAATMSVARELPPKASISARLSRALAFVQLHRLADAEAMVSPLAKSNSTAGLLLAAVYRHQARWTEAERAYRQVLDMLLTQTVRDARSAEDCVAAYDGLADARRGLSRPGDVAQTYCEALERLPGKRGYFHFQIGLHEANQGRSETAFGHFAEAVRLDPELERLATPHVRRLRVDTPSCFTSRPWSRQ